MEFKTIEEAKEYVNKIEAENKNLNDLLENQKVVMSEKEKNITSLNEEINRLKIKNYELFEQVSSNPEQNKSKPQDSHPKMSYQEFLNKVL